MHEIDITAKLCRLGDHLAELPANDATFVTEMLTRLQSGNTPFLRDILRIKDMLVPGEAPPPDPIWKEGSVTALTEDLEKVIWRYMPLEQLFFLLSAKKLHFSPLSKMKDLTEGVMPPRAFEMNKGQLPPHFFDGSGIDADTMTNIMQRQRRDDACLSCWFIGETDSLDMWRDYAPNNGVAIRTTVLRLASSLGTCTDTNINIAPVRYFSPDEVERYTDYASYGDLFIKHDRYAVEKELRALAFRLNLGVGVDIPVDLERLIDHLVLSPELQDWAVPTIIEAIRRVAEFEMRCPIQKSSITV